jgi:hypothetical protein
MGSEQWTKSEESANITDGAWMSQIWEYYLFSLGLLEKL